MPTERRACRETDSAGSNSGVEAPWIEPASRSEPDSASLRLVRSANLSKKPKPKIRREGTFTCNGGDLRGSWGQLAGKVGLGRLGDPCHRLGQHRGKRRAESIRRALGPGESERPIVARKRGNARGAKGPWQNGTDSECDPTALMRCILPPNNWIAGERRCRWRINCVSGENSRISVLRKPDAGNPHVRFVEGQGENGQWPCAFHPVPPAYSTGQIMIL